MSKRLITVLVALMATIGAAAAVSAADDGSENPLEPLDASSPRAAYE